MIRAVLWLFDRLAWLLRRTGIDYDQFRAILEVKLTLDTRRKSNVFQNAGKQSKNPFLLSLLVNLFFGIFPAAVVSVAGSPLVSMTIIFAIVMVMIAMVLVADFSSVLLDTTDNMVLQPRPVTGKTILAARIAHISVYLGLLTLSFSLATFVSGSVHFGLWFTPLFALTLVLALVFLLGLINICYLLLMRFISGERLRDVILYIQIVVTIVVIGGYQLMPRLMDISALRTLDIAGRNWTYFVPPTWLAAIIDLAAGRVRQPQLILAVLGICGPIAAALAAGALAPSFKRGLAQLELERTQKRDQPAVARPTLARRISTLFCRRPVERAAFELIWQIAARDRQFKLRTYPTAGMIFIISAAMILSNPSAAGERLQHLTESKAYLLVLYVASALTPLVMIQMRYSDNHEAAWVYRALPVARPGEILGGAFKALFVRMILFIYLLVAIVVLAIWRARALPDIVVALAATAFIALLQAMLLGRRLPFAEKYAVLEGSGRIIRSMFMMVVPAALGGLHYLLTFAPGGALWELPVLVIVSALAYRLYTGTTWRTLARAGA
jgi:ABC-2 type transport system permease protein